MKLNADVDVSEVIQKLADAGGQIQDDLVDLLDESVINIERKAKRNAPVNVGRLKSSISHERVRNKNKPHASVEVNARYGPYVEFGTKSKVDIPSGLESYARRFKGSGGNFDDLLKNIKQWCRNKGIEQEAAYPIAVKIAREGVGAQPFLFPAYFSEIPKIEKGIARLLKRVAKWTI